MLGLWSFCSKRNKVSTWSIRAFMRSISRSIRCKDWCSVSESFRASNSTAICCLAKGVLNSWEMSRNRRCWLLTSKLIRSAMWLNAKPTSPISSLRHSTRFGSRISRLPRANESVACFSLRKGLVIRQVTKAVSRATMINAVMICNIGKCFNQAG